MAAGKHRRPSLWARILGWFDSYADFEPPNNPLYA